MKSIFEELGGTYTQVGDYFFPDLMLKETDVKLMQRLLSDW